MHYTRITIETRDHVFLMGLNRPEKRNAFDLEMQSLDSLLSVRVECVCASCNRVLLILHFHATVPKGWIRK